MKRYLLLIIVALAVILRFWNLGNNPPSLTWDEAAWGYNAYSLGIDGRDEFGRFLPLDYLESFGDFKPALYAYLDIIPVKDAVFKGEQAIFSVSITNNQANNIDLVVPCNNKGKKSLGLLFWILAKEYLRMKGKGEEFKYTIEEFSPE